MNLKYLKFMMVIGVNMFFFGISFASESNNFPDDVIIVQFADNKELITTYTTLCPDNIKCFFCPYAELRFEPSNRVHRDFGKDIPVIFLPTIRWEHFKVIFDSLSLHVPLKLVSEEIEKTIEFLGYTDYFLSHMVEEDLGEEVSLEPLKIEAQLLELKKMFVPYN